MTIATLPSTMAAVPCRPCAASVRSRDPTAGRRILLLPRVRCWSGSIDRCGRNGCGAGVGIFDSGEAAGLPGTWTLSIPYGMGRKVGNPTRILSGSVLSYCGLLLGRRRHEQSRRHCPAVLETKERKHRKQKEKSRAEQGSRCQSLVFLT
jgi:hypothetical protein